MRRLLLGLIVLSGLLALVLTGCCGGGGTKEVKEVKEPVIITPSGSSTAPTTGQQLQDLKAAHDQGALTDEEFQKAKEKILKEK